MVNNQMTSFGDDNFSLSLSLFQQFFGSNIEEFILCYRIIFFISYRFKTKIKFIHINKHSQTTKFKMMVIYLGTTNHSLETEKLL